MFNLNSLFSILRGYFSNVFAWLCNILIVFFPHIQRAPTTGLNGFVDYITAFQKDLKKAKSDDVVGEWVISEQTTTAEKIDSPAHFNVFRNALGKILFFKSFKKKSNSSFNEVKYLFFMRYPFFINDSAFEQNNKLYRSKSLIFDDKFYNDFYVLYNLALVFFKEINFANLFSSGSYVILFLSNIFSVIFFVIYRAYLVVIFNLFARIVSFFKVAVNIFLGTYRKLFVLDYIMMLFYSVFYMVYIWVVLFNNMVLRLCSLFRFTTFLTKIEYVNDLFSRIFTNITNSILFGSFFTSIQTLSFNWGDLFVKNETIFNEYAGGLKRTFVRLSKENSYVESTFCFWVRRQNFFFITASPWPFLISMFVVIFMAGFVLYFNYYTSSYYLYLGLFLVFIVFSLWCRDFIREIILNENYSPLLFQNFKVGFWLFIVSEFMLFFSFFWALFHSSFEVSIYLGMQWPPMDGVNVNSIKIPFMNTILLVCSGLSLTAAQFGLVAGRLTVYRVSFLYTVFHAVCFLISQLNEYMIAFQQANDSIYGSTMYMLTAFHGMHVFIGLCFLLVCFFRSEFGHMRANDILVFILAGWYWHFVDVVWIGVFLSVYVYGTLYPFILPINFEDIKLYEMRAFI